MRTSGIRSNYASFWGSLNSWARSPRNQKRSTALVTNVEFDKWGDYLPDGPLAMALLDRLVEGAVILKIKGKSYRAHRPKEGDKSA